MLLRAALESEIIRRRIYYLAITASEPEIREKMFKQNFILPWPISDEGKKTILGAVEKIEEAKATLNMSLLNVQNIFNETTTTKES